MNWWKELIALVTEDGDTLKARLEVDNSLSMVKAPVLGFVRTVKENPRRFRCRREFPAPDDKTLDKFAWMHRGNTKFYRIIDKLLGHSFVATIIDGGLYSVTGADIALNGWEKNYLFDQLAPVFIKAANRKHERERKELVRIRIAREMAEQKRRDEWTAIYGE